MHAKVFPHGSFDGDSDYRSQSPCTPRADAAPGPLAAAADALPAVTPFAASDTARPADAPSFASLLASLPPGPVRDALSESMRGMSAAHGQGVAGDIASVRIDADASDTDSEMPTAIPCAQSPGTPRADAAPGPHAAPADALLADAPPLAAPGTARPADVPSLDSFLASWPPGPERDALSVSMRLLAATIADRANTVKASQQAKQQTNNK